MVKAKRTCTRMLSVWYLFIGWAAVVAVAFSLIIGLRTAYKPHEQLTVFVAAYGVKSEELTAELNLQKPDYLHNVGLNYCTAVRNDTIFNANWAQATVTATDLYILPESRVSAEMCNAYFLPLTDEFIFDNFIGVDIYAANDISYGIKVYDKERKIGGMSEYISYGDTDVNENYYIFFGKHTAHLGQAVGTRYEGGIGIAKLFVGELSNA